MYKLNFSLEKWKKEYADDIAVYANNINVAKYLRNVFPNPYTYDDALWYVTDCAENDEEKQVCRAIIVDGKAVGSVGIFIKDDVYSKSGELGYWLGEPFWNKGIMTEAVKLICDYAFKNYDIVRIFAEPYAVNKSSQKVLEKAGFLHEGTLKKSVFKNNEFYDSYIYGLIK